MNSPVKHFYEFGSFRLDLVEQRLLRDGKPVALKPKVFNLLLELVNNSGHILLKEQLMKQVWPDTFVEEHNLAVSVSTLRKTLGGDQNDCQYIETVPRRGYRFIPVVRVVWDDPTAPDTNHRNHATRSPLASAVHSIAVLPFRSIGLKAGEEAFLGLGMADALITRLGNLSQIVVRPTSVVRKFADGCQDPVTAGNELGVSAVLDGSIQKSGNSIRVTVQLVSIEDGTTLWADKFDEKFTDIFAVEDSISEQVTTALTLKITDKDRERLRKRYTENSEAYQAYLKGRFFLSKRTAEDIVRSTQYFKEAIRTDPGYALAYAGLADYYLIAANYDLVSTKEAISESRRAVLQALEIDETLAEAHASLAYLKFVHEWDWAGADREFSRAINLNPSVLETRQCYAIYLRCMRRFDESIAQIKQARELDPLSSNINTTLGSTLHFAGRYDQAIEQLGKTVESDPTFIMAHVYLGLAHEQKGLGDEAIRTFEKVFGARPVPQFKAMLAHAYAVAGRTVESRAALMDLHEVAKHSHVSPYDLAFIHAALGENEVAIDWLERAYHERCEDLVMLGADQRFDPLRKQPRFLNLMNLMDFPR